MSVVDKHELAARTVIKRRMGMRDMLDNTKMEHPKMTIERKTVERIDRFELAGGEITAAERLRSVLFHWWEGDDDPYFYWDLV